MVAQVPRSKNLFHAQLSSIKFILRINVKMITFADILTFIGMINIKSERVFFKVQMKFYAQLC